VDASPLSKSPPTTEIIGASTPRSERVMQSYAEAPPESRLVFKAQRYDESRKYTIPKTDEIKKTVLGNKPIINNFV
jgi:hypothetical protein